MSAKDNDFLAKNQHSRGFGVVLQTEMRTLLPDLPLPAAEPPHNAAEAAQLAYETRLERETAEAIDRYDTPLAALCISGGGIRSASFALGALQGLARFGLLGRFHYLSTVSGGGYIGSWLSVWRSLDSDRHVFEALNAAEREGGDRPQIHGLRADSNYLTPILGLLSADTWTVLALYLRNLILNWLLFLPLFTGCLLIPHLCYAILQTSVNEHDFHSVCYALAGSLLLALSLSAAVYGRFLGLDPWLSNARFRLWVLLPMLASAICYTLAAEFWGTSHWMAGGSDFGPAGVAQGAGYGALIYTLSWVIGRTAAGKRGGPVLIPDLLCWILTGALVGALIAFGLSLISAHCEQTRAVVILGLSAVMLSYLIGDIFYAGLASFSPRGDVDREWLARAAGWVAAVSISWALISAIALFAADAFAAAGRWLVGVGGVSGAVTLILGSSALTAATKAAPTLKNLSLTRVASAVGLVFALTLAALLSVCGQELAQALGSDPKAPCISIDVWLIALLTGGAFLISFLVNVNRFSLHALYRNRLVRAFLGSARALHRQPDPFTGFDPRDNPKMAEVVPVAGEGSLLHVVNTTLNVVSIKNPAWQERKAESFAITRLFSGNPIVRFQPTAVFGDRKGGISLGTAMAISGAAVSPNMGYNSSPLIGFLLMLFNVRLGWWLGNPKKKCYRNEGPAWGIVPALKELAGDTTDQANWMYLSDGGHFENLGIYEMIRRRCRCIVVSDAGADPQCQFEDLGNAVRKIYIDFGVSIEFKELNIKRRETPPVPGFRCAVGSIKYPGSNRLGWIVYIKPAYHGTERADIRGYAAAHPEFPHESTTDQWFSESQLEAYRALGAHTIETICTEGGRVMPESAVAPLDLPTFRQNAANMSGAPSGT